MEFNTSWDAELLSCTLIDYSFDFDGKKKFVSLLLEVRYGESMSWRVKRRQRVFENLAEILTEYYTGIPPLPNTMNLFGDNYSKPNVLKRMEKYEAWIRTFITRKEIYSLPYVCLFFDVYHNADVSTSMPVLLGMIHSKKRNFIGLHLDVEQRLLISVSNPMMKTQTVGHLITNYIIGNKNQENMKSSLIQYDTKHKAVGVVTYHSIQAEDSLKATGQESMGIEVKMNVEAGEGKVETEVEVEEPEEVKDEEGNEGIDQHEVAIEHITMADHNATRYANENQKQTPSEKTSANPQKSEPQQMVSGEAPRKNSKSDPHNPSKSSTKLQLSSCMLNFDAKHCEGYLSEVSAVSFSPSGKAVALGFENGSIALFNHDDSKFFNHQTYLNAFKGKVVKLQFDVKRKALVCLGEDCKLLLLDILKGKPLGCVILPGSTPANYSYDEQSRLCFVSTVGQSIYVVDVSSEYMRIVNKISTKLNILKSLYVYFAKGFQIVYAGSRTDGTVRVFQSHNFYSPKPDPCCMMQLKGIPGLRVMTYWRERDELYCGYDNGCIRVYTNLPKFTKISSTQISLGFPQFSHGPVCKYLVIKFRFLFMKEE